MIVTSIAHADNYLFGEPDVLSMMPGTSLSPANELQAEPVANTQNNWLLPGSSNSRTQFRGGMAHFQFDSGDDNDGSSMLPGNTRFTLSMGLEEHELSSLDGNNSQLDSQEWYDRYRPMLYFSIGHRW